MIQLEGSPPPAFPQWPGELKQAAQEFTLMFILAWLFSGMPPVRVTSWYRDPLRNASVGGQSNSQHLFAAAMDLAGDGARQVGRLFDQIGGVAVDEGDHVHIQRFTKGVGPRLR